MWVGLLLLEGVVAFSLRQPTHAGNHHVRSRCFRMVEATSAADEATLLAECRREERSLATIEQLVSSLKSQPLPTKPKKALLGDWLLEFASDAEAVGRITNGDVGPFAVIEGVIHRFLKGNEVESIEVLRRFGPFGNMKRSLNGRWGVDKDGEGQAIRWRYTYQIDGDGRERDTPKQETTEAQLGYSSSDLLIFGFGDSVLVFSRIPSLDTVLVDLRVAAPPEVEEK